MTIILIITIKTKKQSASSSSSSSRRKACLISSICVLKEHCDEQMPANPFISRIKQEFIHSKTRLVKI